MASVEAGVVSPSSLRFDILLLTRFCCRPGPWSELDFSSGFMVALPGSSLLHESTLKSVFKSDFVSNGHRASSFPAAEIVEAFA